MKKERKDWGRIPPEGYFPRREWYRSYYLQSVHWKELSKFILFTHGKMCVVCGNTKALHVHHLSYKRLWHEGPKDLIVLCKQCHKRCHASENPKDKEFAINLKKKYGPKDDN